MSGCWSASLSKYARQVHVVGNVQAENAKQVSVTSDSTVGGSIQIKQGGAATIHRVRVTGDVQFKSNSGALSAHENRVGGNLKAFRNRGVVRIVGNVIDGDLQCKENGPAPKGSNNLVKGSKKDQCRQFRLRPSSRGPGLSPHPSGGWVARKPTG